METTNGKKSITVHEKTGNEEIEITVLVTQEELEQMEQLRNGCPETWEGNELELLQQARKVLKENSTKNTKEEPLIEDPKVEAEQCQAKGSNAIWWVIGVLAIFTLTMKIITKSQEKKLAETRDKWMESYLDANGYNFDKETKPDIQKDLNPIVEDVLKKPTLPSEHNIEISDNNSAEIRQNLYVNIKYKGIKFYYPQNWHITTEDISDDTFLVDVSNNNVSELHILWTSNKLDKGKKDFINSSLSELESSLKIDLEHTTIVATKFNGMDALSTNFSCKYDGIDAFVQIIAFENKKYLAVASFVASSKAELENDFKIIKNTIAFSE